MDNIFDTHHFRFKSPSRQNKTVDAQIKYLNSKIKKIRKKLKIA